MAAGIYIITNRVNGKAYIGRSVDIAQRWAQHRSEANRKPENPIHRAIAKYGHESFDFAVIIIAPYADLSNLERQFILSRNTLSPGGYNTGGTSGGFPCRGLMSEMEPEARERRMAQYISSAKKGSATFKAMREDPGFDTAAFRQARSKASVVREQNIRAKRAIDPEYDAKIRAKRSMATSNRTEGYQHKGVSAFKARMDSDPEFAAKVRENRRRAAASGHARRWHASVS